MNYSIKLQLGDDIRRTSLAVPRYDLLCQIIRQLFPALKSDFAVRYVDEDGDSITVSTDLEMSEALKGRNSSGLVKFLVVAVEGTKPSATLPAATNTNNVKPQVQPLPNLFNQLPTFDVTPFLSGYVAPVLQQIQQQAQTQVQNMDLCSMWSQLQTLLSNPSTAAQIQPVLSTFQQLALQAQNQAQNVNWNGLTAQIEKVLQDPATIANAQVYQFVNMVKQMIPQVPVATTNTSTPSASIPNNNNQPSVVSHAAICDNCQQSITGIRFKCANCADYDLCESCEAKRPHDEEHIFLKIYKPALICTRSALLANLYQSKPSEAHGKDAPRCPRRTQGLSSKFISDVTIPDGSETECGSKFVKTWRMRNDGSNAWPEGTVLKFVGGAAMSETATVPVKPLAVGEEVDVSVNMTAPSVPARYISYFRLCTPDGVRFGHRVWVDFITTAKNEPVQPEPVETQAPSAPQEVAPEPTPVPQPVTPAPQPVATSPAAEPAAPLSKQALLDICMEDDLKELASMGFTDKEKNKKLWKESKGDMPTIVSRLLNNY